MVGACAQVVRWFWEVAHALPADKQKRLLAFVTGSDRVPIKGLGALNPPFVISRRGGVKGRGARGWGWPPRPGAIATCCAPVRLCW